MALYINNLPLLPAAKWGCWVKKYHLLEVVCAPYLGLICPPNFRGKPSLWQRISSTMYLLVHYSFRLPFTFSIPLSMLLPCLICHLKYLGVWPLCTYINLYWLCFTSERLPMLPSPFMKCSYYMGYDISWRWDILPALKSPLHGGSINELET